MAISFIPNQPILFDDPLFAGQTCLNNDTRAYAQLAQSGDSTCIQWKNEPIANLFDCQMNQQPNNISNGDFDASLTGWTEINLVTGAAIPGNPDFNFNGTDGVNYTWVGAPKGLYTTSTIPIGNLVLVSLETNMFTSIIYIAVGDHNTNTWNGAYIKANTDNRIVVALYALAGNDILIASPFESATLSNVIVRDINFNYCYIPNSESFHFSYVESINGFQVIDIQHSLLLQGLLINGSTYKISFKVTNMSATPGNYIGVYDATTSQPILTAYENGEYELYYTHAGANTQILITYSNDASLVGAILYDLKVDVLSYNYRVRISNLDGSCASINYDSSSIVHPIQFYEDRIIWCFQWDNLINCDNPFVGLDTGCYKITIDDLDEDISYDSYTVINYKATGAHECSVMVVGNNEGSAFGLYFNNTINSIAFTLRQRLRLLQFNPTYPAKVNEYLYSNGDHVRTYAESAKFRIAWFDYVDEPTHDVIRLQMLSDTLTIDGNYFFCKAEDYEPEWGQNGKYNLAQSRVLLKAVAEPTVFNKSCI